jgi:hypothetical protein
MELCYKLNIPNFKELVKDEYLAQLTFHKMNEFAPMVNVPNGKTYCDLVKEQYQNFNDIEWHKVLAFPLTKESKSFIHSDNWADTRPLGSPPITLWAINFVIEGVGNQSYWLPEQLDHEPFTDADSGYQVNYSTNELPYKSYDMPPGAYLVNITVPHMGKALSDERLVVSVRPKLNIHSLNEYWTNKSWDDIVNLFDKYIVK